MEKNILLEISKSVHICTIAVCLVGVDHLQLVYFKGSLYKKTYFFFLLKETCSTVSHDWFKQRYTET